MIIAPPIRRRLRNGTSDKHAVDNPRHCDQNNIDRAVSAREIAKKSKASEEALVACKIRLLI